VVNIVRLRINPTVFGPLNTKTDEHPFFRERDADLAGFPRVGIASTVGL